MTKLARVKALQPWEHESCRLDRLVQLAVLLSGARPCAGCNHDRAACGGEPKAATPAVMP